MEDNKANGNITEGKKAEDKIRIKPVLLHQGGPGHGVSKARPVSLKPKTCFLLDLEEPSGDPGTDETPDEAAHTDENAGE